MATAVKSGLHHTHTEGLGQTDQDSILLFLWSWHSSCKLLLLCSSQGWWCDCDSSNTYRILICIKAQDLYWSVSHLVLVLVCLSPPPPLTLHLPYIHITLCDWLWLTVTSYSVISSQGWLKSLSRDWYIYSILRPCQTVKTNWFSCCKYCWKFKNNKNDWFVKEFYWILIDIFVRGKMARWPKVR